MSTTVDQSVQIAELQREVHGLRRELAALRSSMRGPEPVDARTLAHCVTRLFKMTNDLIPGDVRVENRADPEHPETVYLVFCAAAHTKMDNADAIISTEIEWHRRARAILRDATCYFRVSIE